MFRSASGLDCLVRDRFISRWLFDVELLGRYIAWYGSSASCVSLWDSIYEYPLPQWHEMSGSKLRARDLIQCAIDLELILFRYGFRERRRQRSYLPLPYFGERTLSTTDCPPGETPAADHRMLPHY
jgi:hypothetical protein